jgi:hypothetical protein
MTVIESGSGNSGLVARVKNILLRPKSEWEVIDAEPTTVQRLYTGYICILAAIPVVAAAIGSLVFGHGIPGLAVWRPSPVYIIVSSILSYVLALVGVAIIAMVIDALAPSFGGTKDRIQAFKVAAYSYTAAWVAGILGIVPALAMIGALLGLYSFYLLYLGLPRLMKAPQDKAIGYTVVTVVVSIVVYLIIAAIVGAIMAATLGAAALGGMATGRSIATADGGHVTLGGNLGKMQAAAEQMAAAANGDPKAVKAVPSDTLKAMLPGDLGGGFARTELSGSSGSAAGIGGSNAEGRYVNGDSSIRLSVTDMAAMGAMATLGGALNVESSRDTATGYERVGKVNGRMTSEEYDRQARSGKYMVMVADRFAIEAEGDQVDMNQLKAAVGAVNPGRLEALARS